MDCDLLDCSSRGQTLSPAALHVWALTPSSAATLHLLPQKSRTRSQWEQWGSCIPCPCRWAFPICSHGRESMTTLGWMCLAPAQSQPKPQGLLEVGTCVGVTLAGLSTCLGLRILWGGREGCPGPLLWLISWWESHDRMQKELEEDPAHIHGNRTFCSCEGTRGSKGLWLG